MTETEWYDHESTPLTVGQLLAELSPLPVDALVALSAPEEADGASSTIINAVSVELRPGGTGRPEQLVISGSYPTGRYQRTGRRSLTVTGLPTDDSDAGEAEILALQQAVDTVIRGRGHRGSSSMSRDEQAGSITWTWVHKNVPTDSLVAAAASVAEALNPGGWQVHGRR